MPGQRHLRPLRREGPPAERQPDAARDAHPQVGGGRPRARRRADHAEIERAGGKIRLIIAVRATGELAGVRVTQHKETPGLGDYVEVRKDKNKARPWITQFTGLSLAQVSDREWKVKKDGGRIDYYAGATITPRAVTKATLKAVQWATAQRDRLFAEGDTR